MNTMRETSADWVADLMSPRARSSGAASWDGPSVIGFCGLAGAGKSTAAAYLREVHGFERHRFAGPLKAMLRAFGLTEAEVDGHDKDVPSPLLGGKTPRQAMQWLGTEWGRTLIDPDVWTRSCLHKVASVLDHGGRVVLDDVRFVNEAAAIRAYGGRVVKITSPSCHAKPPRHISETIGFEWDAEIFNDGRDLHHLHGQIEKTLRAVGLRPPKA